jgi:signal transduction histidine kinase
MAMIYGLQAVLAPMMEGRAVTLWGAVWRACQTYWVFALLTPPVIEFSARVELQRGRAARFIALHCGAFLAFVFLQGVLRVLLFPVHDPRTWDILPRSIGLVWRSMLLYITDDIFIYIPIAGGTLAYVAYQQNRERELAQSKLRAQLAGAELQILKMQLQPHFLFNTLQAISTLVGKDPATARKMIALLGDLLRTVIDRTGEQVVPLKDELDLLDRYVQIEHVRFGDQLLVDFHVDDRTIDVAVPSLVLQPLVENAIRHGARSVKGRGEILVASAMRDGKLVLTVEDNGPGMPPPEQRDPRGLGLQNTRARLDRLYGSRYRFDLQNRAEGGVRATIEIPVEREGAA